MQVTFGTRLVADVGPAELVGTALEKRTSPPQLEDADVATGVDSSRVNAIDMPSGTEAKRAKDAVVSHVTCSGHILYKTWYLTLSDSSLVITFFGKYNSISGKASFQIYSFDMLHQHRQHKIYRWLG